MSFESKRKPSDFPVKTSESNLSSEDLIVPIGDSVSTDRFNKLVKLVENLFEYKTSREFFDISNFIVLFLYTFDKRYPIKVFLKEKISIFDKIKEEFNNILNIEFGDTQNKYLMTLKIIRFFLNNTPQLNLKQKSEYAKVERHFMKLFLSELTKGLK